MMQTENIFEAGGRNSASEGNNVRAYVDNDEPNCSKCRFRVYDLDMRKNICTRRGDMIKECSSCAKWCRT